jgi:hypothetical protein
MQAGAKAGIVIGSVAGAFSAGGLIYLLIRSIKKRSDVRAMQKHVAGELPSESIEELPATRSPVEMNPFKDPIMLQTEERVYPYIPAVVVDTRFLTPDSASMHDGFQYWRER